MNFDLQAYDQLANLNAQSIVEDVRKALAKIEEEFRQGQGDAGFILGFLYSPDNAALSDKVKLEIGASHAKSIKYFEAAHPMVMREALAGSGRSMHLIALYYQNGFPPVAQDTSQYESWKNKALKAGYRGAGQL